LSTDHRRRRTIRLVVRVQLNLDFFYWRNRHLKEIPTPMHHAIKVTNIRPRTMVDPKQIAAAFPGCSPDAIQFVWCSYRLASVNKEIVAIDEVLDDVMESGNKAKVRPSRYCLPGFCTCNEPVLVSEELNKRREKVRFAANNCASALAPSIH
jgi:hypothetical protein